MKQRGMKKFFSIKPFLSSFPVFESLQSESLICEIHYLLYRNDITAAASIPDNKNVFYGKRY